MTWCRRNGVSPAYLLCDCDQITSRGIYVLISSAIPHELFQKSYESKIRYFILPSRSASDASMTAWTRACPSIRWNSPQTKQVNTRIRELISRCEVISVVGIPVETISIIRSYGKPELYYDVQERII